MNKMNFKKTKKTIIDEIAGSVKSAGFKYDKNDEFFPKRYTILKEEDVAEVIDKALTDIRKYIMPYFEQNVTVERMDQILNRKPKEYTVHNSTYPNRAMMGLIAAKLVNNPRYDELVSIYDVELAGAAIDAKREYQKLKEWLSKMPITA